MRTIELNGQTGASRILVGESLANLRVHLAVHRAILITDPLVRRLYQDLLPPCPILEIGMGEETKTLDTVASLYQRLLDLEADRTNLLVGVGGGIVCDITGLAASTYMRGLPFALAPTTLLAQADAAIGGKNGVNLGGYKNIIGVFRQPGLVLCDPQVLKTLPEKELRCGLAEIVKHALIADRDLFSRLEALEPGELTNELVVMEELVYRSILIKSTIVKRDEKEAGERRVLNFGHTFGHAMEKTARLSHGQAVSLGMVIAAELSVKKGYLAGTEKDRIEALLGKLGLPTHLLVDKGKVLEALRKDKKRARNTLHFVFLKGIGEARIENLPMRELEELYAS
jgi:3-dehydroquinate synthase